MKTSKLITATKPVIKVPKTAKVAKPKQPAMGPVTHPTNHDDFMALGAPKGGKY